MAKQPDRKLTGVLAKYTMLVGKASEGAIAKAPSAKPLFIKKSLLFIMESNRLLLNQMGFCC